MTTLSTTETTTGADAAPELTDGYHLVVEALKLNDVHTIYGVVGIPITDVARVAQHRVSATSVSGMKAMRGTRRRRPGS